MKIGNKIKLFYAGTILLIVCLVSNEFLWGISSLKLLLCYKPLFYFSGGIFVWLIGTFIK